MRKNAVGLWMGLKGDDALDHALPNRMNFDKCAMWSDHDLFENGVSTWKCTEDDADGDGVVDGADQCPDRYEAVLTMAFIFFSIRKWHLLESFDNSQTVVGSKRQTNLDAHHLRLTRRRHPLLQQ